MATHPFAANDASVRAAVCHGDATTTGGFVFAFTEGITDNGRCVALHGDEATCGECKGTFKIHGSAYEMTFGTTRPVVLHGDRVLCPCGRNKVLMGSAPGIWYHDHEVPQVDGSPARRGDLTPAYSSVFDQTFTLCCVATREPLGGVRYWIHTASGIVSEGVTDEAGQTTRIKTNEAERIRLSIEV